MVKKTKNIKRMIALILALLATAFLVINSISILIQKNNVVKEIIDELNNASQAGQVEGMDALVSLIPKIILVMVVLWLVLAVVMAYITYLVENKKGKWWYLLIASIFALILTRIDTAVAGVISSILYYEKKN